MNSRSGSWPQSCLLPDGFGPVLERTPSAARSPNRFRPRSHEDRPRTLLELLIRICPCPPRPPVEKQIPGRGNQSSPMGAVRPVPLVMCFQLQSGQQCSGAPWRRRGRVKFRSGYDCKANGGVMVSLVNRVADVHFRRDLSGRWFLSRLPPTGICLGTATPLPCTTSTILTAINGPNRYRYRSLESTSI